MARPEEVRESIKEDSLDLFWQFINERQQAWYRRVVENRPSPWTSDEILRKYRFTNVYRQLDPGTQYAIQDILEADAARYDKVFNIMIYRLIGRLETHRTLGFRPLNSFDPEAFEQDLKHRRDTMEEPVFTGAYMVSGYNHRGSSDKVENVASIFSEIASRPTIFNDLLESDSVESAYELIRSQPGFGNFLSYQVLVDLLYPLNCYGGESILPFSADEWSSPGPGAQKGLEVLVPSFDRITYLDVMRWLRQHQGQEFERLNLDFPYLRTTGGNRLELSLANIQNCLCEFYKYQKILHSNGRARRRFRESGARSSADLKSLYKDAPYIRMPENF